MAYPLNRCAIGPATMSDIEFVTLNMRRDEIDQWCANTGRADYDPWLCARTLAHQDGPQYALLDPDGRVFAVGGLVPQRPGVYQTWAAALEGSWDRYWQDITAHCRAIIDDALANGAQRVETVALASRVNAARWYRKGLRQRYEGTMRRYFADGSAAVIYARTRED